MLRNTYGPMSVMWSARESVMIGTCSSSATSAARRASSVISGPMMAIAPSSKASSSTIWPARFTSPWLSFTTTSMSVPFKVRLMPRITASPSALYLPVIGSTTPITFGFTWLRRATRSRSAFASAA